MARITSSLPTPVSPITSTQKSDGATNSISQVLHGRGRADDLPGMGGAGLFHQILGDQAHFFGAVFQGFDQVDGVQLGAGQGPNGGDKAQVQRFE